MGVKQWRRPVNGILLLDKPIGLSSNTALQQVKRLFAAAKAGHTGTLDPLASGMLPICLGEATKFSQFLLDADKVYQATIRLGIRTDTGDAEGQVIRQVDSFEVNATQLEQALLSFQGHIQQIPPMFSAIKQAGKPLYQLARQGLTVERQPRSVTIHYLRVIQAGNSPTIELCCSKGTYVRSLVDDLGEMLGCGAHITALRRLTVMPYQTEQLVQLDDLQTLAQQQNWPALDALLLPIDTPLQHLPIITLKPVVLSYFLKGQAVRASINYSEQALRVYDEQQQFIGIAKPLTDGRIAPQRLVANANIE